MLKKQLVTDTLKLVNKNLSLLKCGNSNVNIKKLSNYLIKNPMYKD